MTLNKKVYLAIAVIASFVLISADMVRSGAAPGGYTGADGSTCLNCHGGNPLNAFGGSVTINNLPDTYTPGTTYNNLSVTINHGSSNRTRWGFALKAVAGGSAAGTLGENNLNAYVNTNDQELGHLNAPFTGQTNTYTFNNLSWTAPSNPTPAQQNITFYIAANASGSNDFIYTSTKTISLTPTSVTNQNIFADDIKTIISGKNIFVRFELKRPATIQTGVYNINGQKVLSLAQQKLPVGSNNLSIDGSKLSAGTYIIQLQNDKENISRKIRID
jgi:hypothetical protein